MEESEMETLETRSGCNVAKVIVMVLDTLQSGVKIQKSPPPSNSNM